MKTLSTLIITLLAVLCFACSEDDAAIKGSISGIVVPAEDITSEDIAQMMIYIESSSETSTLKDSISLNETGEFSFSKLEMGDYILYINSEDNTTTVSISESTPDYEFNITVNASTNMLFEVYGPYATGVIYGTVQAGQGVTQEDIAQMQIYLKYNGNLRTLNLDETGNFKFSKLEFRSYLLYVNNEDNAISVSINSAIPEIEQNITVEASSNFF